MRYGIFGDIHANLAALEAVLKFLDGQRVDALLCTGDVVGYYDEPGPCVQLVRERCLVCVAGNHDFLACGKMNVEEWNPFAKQLAQRQRDLLCAKEREWLAGLPLVAHFEGFTLVHASARNPEAFNYVTVLEDVELSLDYQYQPLLFYGHTHIPIVYFGTAPLTVSMEPTIQLNANVRTMVNVGAVGQPRDEDPRACCAIYDTEAQVVRLQRIEYQARPPEPAGAPVPAPRKPPHLGTHSRA